MNSLANRLGVISLVLTGIMGCSPARTTGQGASRAESQEAVLFNGNSTHIWVKSIDGKTMDLSAHGVNRLSPGRHKVRLQYAWRDGWIDWTGDEIVEYSFEAKPGAKLQIVCEHVEAPRRIQTPSYVGTWKVWIEDTASKSIIAPEGGVPAATHGATGENTQPAALPEVSD